MIAKTPSDIHIAMSAIQQKPEPPEAPADHECCGSGCEPCVFDTYAEKLARYRQQLSEWEIQNKERAKHC